MGTLFAGCGRPAEDAGDGSVIAVSTTKFGSVDSFFSDCEYTILETSDSCMLHGRAIYHTSDKYIVAYSKNSGFDVFDRKGKHIKHFSNYGQGPGEAVFINDYYISGDEIVCVPFMQPKLFVFNAQTGELTKEISLPDSYYYASAFDNDLVALSPLYSNQSKWNIEVYNTESDSVVGRYLPYEQLSSVIMNGFNVFVGEGEKCVYGVLPFDYNLYRVSADECSVVCRYEFDTPEQVEPFNTETVKLSELSERYRYDHVVKWLGKYCETNSGAHYQHFDLLCDYGIKPYLCKYSGSKSQSETLRIGVDVFEQFPYLTSGPFEMKGGYYICAMDASTLLYLDQTRNSDTFAKLGLHEDSNPVIFFYKLKD